MVKDTATEQFLAMRRKDQQRALQHLREDPGLRWGALPVVQHNVLLLVPCTDAIASKAFFLC